MGSFFGGGLGILGDLGYLGRSSLPGKQKEGLQRMNFPPSAMQKTPSNPTERGPEKDEFHVKPNAEIRLFRPSYKAERLLINRSVGLASTIIRTLGVHAECSP